MQLSHKLKKRIGWILWRFGIRHFRPCTFLIDRSYPVLTGIHTRGWCECHLCPCPHPLHSSLVSQLSFAFARVHSLPISNHFTSKSKIFSRKSKCPPGFAGSASLGRLAPRASGSHPEVIPREQQSPRASSSHPRASGAPLFGAQAVNRIGYRRPQRLHTHRRQRNPHR